MLQTITPKVNERIARLVSAGLELRDSFAAFAAEVAEFVPHHYARLILLDESGENCRVAAEVGDGPGLALGAFPYAGSGVEAATKAGRPVYVLLDAATPPVGLVREFAAALLLPLLFQERGLGAVELYTHEKKGLKVNRRQEQELTSLGYYFSAIANNAILYTQLASGNEQLTTALQQAAARSAELDTVISEMVDGVAISDTEGRIVRLNPQGEAILGRPAAPTADLSVHAEVYNLYTSSGELYPTERLPLYAALYQRKVVTDATILVHHSNGQERAVVVSAAPLLDERGELTGGLMVMRDVTAARAAERVRDEFIANISHELRTPLASILGYSDILLRRGNLPERQQRQQEAIRSNAQRLLTLVNDLLDVSRLEVGILGLEFRALDLGAAIGYALAFIQATADHKNIQLNQLVMSDLPLAWADEQRVNQILSNLLSNAVKFTPEGGNVTVRASLLTPAEDADPGEQAMLAVQVIDSGIGVAADQLERIWDRFYQVESSSTRRFGGAGLGLAISKQLVELHGGRIIATSKGEGEGTTISFTLPLADARSAPLASVDMPAIPLASAPPRVHHEAGPDAPLVLVVEDDPDFSQILATMLGDAGYNAISIADGQQVAAMARELSPAAITLDINLPRADGWSILNQLKANPETAAIPVVVVSIVDNKRFGYSLGANEYLVKPIEREQLLTVMGRILGSPTPGRSVMVVEDNPDLRELLRSVLSDAGWQVREAGNGQLALERIAADPPTLVILDLMLPLVDGFEVLRSLRQSPDTRLRDLPVLVLTAKALTPAERRELATTAQRTMHKASIERDQLARQVVDNIEALLPVGEC